MSDWKLTEDGIELSDEVWIRHAGFDGETLFFNSSHYKLSTDTVLENIEEANMIIKTAEVERATPADEYTHIENIIFESTDRVFLEVYGKNMLRVETGHEVFEFNEVLEASYKDYHLDFENLLGFHPQGLFEGVAIYSMQGQGLLFEFYNHAHHSPLSRIFLSATGTRGKDYSENFILGISKNGWEKKFNINDCIDWKKEKK